MGWLDYLSETGEAIADPLVTLWNKLVEVVPGLVAAIVIIIVGYFVAAAIGWVVKKAIVKTKLDDKLEESGRADAIGNVELSTLIGQILKWYVFVIFLVPAASVLEFGELSSLLTKFALYLPSVIAGVVIVLFGLIFADFVADKIDAMKTKWSKTVGLVARIILIFFFLNIALKQIGIDVAIAENTFLILIGGIALALSLAVGIGFGLGLKDEAKSIIKKWKK